MRVVIYGVLCSFVLAIADAAYQDTESTCKFTPGVNSNIEYILGDGVDLNDSALHMRVVKDNLTGSVIQCYRKHVQKEPECTAILTGVESKGFEGHKLTLTFPNLTPALLGTYTLRGIANSTSLDPISCTAVSAANISEEKTVDGSESGKTDHLVAKIVPPVLVACLLVVICVAVFILYKKGCFKCPRKRRPPQQTERGSGPASQELRATEIPESNVRNEAENPDIVTTPLRHVNSTTDIFNRLESGGTTDVV